MSSKSLYVIEWAKESNLQEVLSFLHENFDKEEVVLKSMRNYDPFENEEAMWIDHEKIIKAIFTSSPCMIVKHESTGRIIAVNQMIVSKNPRFDTTGDGVTAVFVNNPPKTKLMERYFNYLSGIAEKANLYEKFPDAKAAVEFYAVVVDKEHRGKGLAKMLIKEGISFATNLDDVGFIFGIFTSSFSSKAAEQLGFWSVMQVDLLKETDEKGRLIFQDTPPHNIVSVLVLDI
ncbi:uncharacterized protein LOC144473064 [Augochlora pura]